MNFVLFILFFHLHDFVYLPLIHSYSIIPCHVVSHVIITWSNTSSIPHQYPIPVTQFILSLRTAATSTTSTTHSFTIPTELPSSKIKIWALSHFSKLYHRGLSPLSYPYKYIHLPHWIQPALWLNWLPTLCYWAILHYKNTDIHILFPLRLWPHIFPWLD